MKFDTAADIIKSAPRFWRKLKSKNRQKSISSSSSSCFSLRGRHRKDRAPSPKSVNSRTRVRAKYSRGLPVAWTKVARFTAEGGRGTLKRENKRRERTERQIQVVRCSDSFHAQTNTRGLPLWNFPKDTEHASLPSRICAKCYYIFSCIYNITLNLLIIPLPYFLSSRNFIYNFKFEKNSTKKNCVFREIAMAARFPFFRLKVEMMEWMVARGIPQHYNSEMHTCRNRGGAQQRRPRWNVLTHNEIVLFHGSLEAVGSFRFSPCSKHVPYPRISVYPVFENSPSTCHRHPTNFIHFERRNERKICSLSSPPTRFGNTRLR